MGIKPKDSKRGKLTKRASLRETERMWHQIDPDCFYNANGPRRIARND